MVSFIVLAVVALGLALMPAHSLAGDGKDCTDKNSDSKVTKTAAKTPGCAATCSKPCGAKTSTTAQKASATTTAAKGKVCSLADPSTCVGVSKAELAKLCESHENCEMRCISVKGMTCTSCEETISAALTDVTGVLKVVKVSYKDGCAIVCVEKDNCNGESLINAVANKGYTAEMIPAVATTGGSASPSACCASRKATTDKTSDGSL